MLFVSYLFARAHSPKAACGLYPTDWNMYDVISW